MQEIENTIYEPGLLDKIRIEKDAKGLQSYFSRELSFRRRHALTLLSDECRQFQTCYCLNSIIYSNGLTRYLGRLQKDSLCLTYLISSGRTETLKNLFTHRKGSKDNRLYDAVKWIFTTGRDDDGLNEEYDNIIDVCSLLLTKVYKDKSVLSDIAGLIFKRNKEGGLIHDLSYAFFEASDPESLLLIANGLASNDRDDNTLSCHLLNFIPLVDENKLAARNDMYIDTCNWINENLPFIYRTSESLQSGILPAPYSLSLEHKYLCKPVRENYSPSLRHSDEEEELLKGFVSLPDETKTKLSNFSHKLYTKNTVQWDAWIHLPIENQLKSLYKPL